MGVGGCGWVWVWVGVGGCGSYIALDDRNMGPVLWWVRREGALKHGHPALHSARARVPPHISRHRCACISL